MDGSAFVPQKQAPCCVGIHFYHLPANHTHLFSFIRIENYVPQDLTFNKSKSNLLFIPPANNLNRLIFLFSSQGHQPHPVSGKISPADCLVMPCLNYGLRRHFISLPYMYGGLKRALLTANNNLPIRMNGHTGHFSSMKVIDFLLTVFTLLTNHTNSISCIYQFSCASQM